MLDLGHSPLTKLRMKLCRSIDDVLFMLMTMADDRAVREVYVMGAPVGRRRGSPAAEAAPLRDAADVLS